MERPVAGRHYENAKYFLYMFLIVVSVFMIAELDSKLQSAEARCKVLEKQLDYMRKMVENAKKERNALMENQVAHKGTNYKKNMYLNIFI